MPRPRGAAPRRAGSSSPASPTPRTPGGVRALPLFLTAAGQACILGAIEIIGRRGLAPEQTRRLAHVAGAASVAVLPFVLTLTELGVLAVFFTGLLAWPR